MGCSFLTFDYLLRGLYVVFVLGRMWSRRGTWGEALFGLWYVLACSVTFTPAHGLSRPTPAAPLCQKALARSLRDLAPRPNPSLVNRLQSGLHDGHVKLRCGLT